MTEPVDRLNTLADQLRQVAADVRPKNARAELRHVASIAGDLVFLAECVEHLAYELRLIVQPPTP